MATSKDFCLLDKENKGETTTYICELGEFQMPSQPTSTTDDHVRHFGDRYTNFLQRRESNDDIEKRQQRKDIQQEVDYAVSRAMEKLSLSSSPKIILGHGFGTPGADAQADSVKSDKEAVLADVLAAAEKLMGCTTSPNNTAKAPIITSPSALTTQPLPQQNPVVSTPLQLQMAMPTATLAPYNSEHELLDTFLARFDKFVTFFKWSEDDKLFYLRNNLGSIADSILCDAPMAVHIQRLLNS